MPVRRLTIWFSVLSLLVALVLVVHDAGMAAGLRHPHEHRAETRAPIAHDTVGHHAAAPDHGSPRHDAARHAPTDAELLCVSFEATRTNQWLPDIDALAAIAIPFEVPPTLGGEDSWAGDPAPGAPPGQLRAFLQVWLN
jgi:hypothetical protein